MSLVEILVVVMILGILAALIVPATGMNEQARLQQAARLVIADIELAQVQSMGNGEDPCLIAFDLALNRYYVARVSTPNTPITDPGTNRPLTTGFGDADDARGAVLTGVVIEACDMGGNASIAFDAFGVPNLTSNGVLTLCCGNASLRVEVDAVTGEASIE